MPPTLASLVQHSALKLTVRAGEDQLDRPVRWAHVSELADPVPYMEGGELLLITAMTLDAEDPRGDAPLRAAAGGGRGGRARLRGRRELRRRCRTRWSRRPARRVCRCSKCPRRTPFLAISKAVSAAIAADQYRAVTAGFEAQRELTRAALAGRPRPTCSPGSPRTSTAGPRCTTPPARSSPPPPSGPPAAPPGSPPTSTGCANAPAPASAVVGGADDGVRRPGGAPVARHRPPAARRARRRHGRAARHRRALRGPLRGRPADPHHRTLPRPPGGRAAARRGGAADAARPAQPDHARAVAGRPVRRSAGRAVPAAHRRGGRGRRATEPPAAAASLGRAHGVGAPRSGEAVLVVPEGQRRLVGRSRRDGGAGGRGRAWPTSAAEGEDDSSSGSPRRPARSPRPPRTSRPSRRCRWPGGAAEPLVEHEELAAGSVLPLLADDAVRAFADGMLRALHEHDATGRGDLVASLRAWLSRHGQWDAAAADLGVHRHTLRYRMRRVEEILGRSLDDPDVRMELWLALKATPPPGYSPRAPRAPDGGPADLGSAHRATDRRQGAPSPPAHGRRHRAERSPRRPTTPHPDTAPRPRTVHAWTQRPHRHRLPEGRIRLSDHRQPPTPSGSPAARPPARTPSTSPRPGTAGSSARSRVPDRRPGRGGRRRRPRRRGGVRRDPRARARRRPRPRVAAARRAHRGDRPADLRRERQADQVGPRRGRPRGLRVPLRRRGGPPLQRRRGPAPGHRRRRRRAASP